MAVPVARVHLAMAHAALPGLLPTPALMTVPTPPPLMTIILPKPGRADTVDRWDASKNPLNKSPSKPAAGRADAAERWDARRIAAQASIPASSPPSSGSSGHQSSPDGNKSSRSSSCARWDSNKKIATPSSSSSSSSISSSRIPASRAASSSRERWDSNKQQVSGRSSSAERWDAHKKPRPPQADGLDDDDDDGQSSTGSNDMEADDTPRPQLMMGLFAAPGFHAAPEPSMLPIPAFLTRSRCVAA